MANLYKYGLGEEMKRLDNENFDERIKDTIKKFIDDMKFKENLTEVRLISYVTRLRVVARWIPDKFLKPDSEAMGEVLKQLAASNYSESTKATYVTMIKKFYKWYLGNNKTYPEFLDGIKRPKNNNNTTPESLLTQDDINSLIGASANARDRAMFSTLFDSGVRIGELLTMRIKDLSFDEYGAIMKVNGKTGYRQVRIVGNSIAYLRAWLDNHPDRNNPDSYLFCGMSNEKKGNMLLYQDVYAIIRRTVKRAGIKKRIHPHLFRHTRATILASKVTEAPLESQMGWIHGSRQTRTYVHLSMRDQDNAILKAYGIKVNEDDTIKEDRPKECPRCHQLNPSDATYCRNCWMPFDIKVALDIEEKEKMTAEALEKSGVLDSILLDVLKKVPENSKMQMLVTILENVSQDPEKRRKVRETLNQISNR
ncbi:MAG: tyrosine-type recombinase/integrase [Candidatus Parvarchaeota archaeon]